MSENKEKLEEEVIETETTEEAEVEAEEVVQPSEEEKLSAQLKEQNDKYLRLMAEYANYQNRTQKEKAARYADAVIDTVSELLPIGDNLERALKTEVTSEDAIKFKEIVGSIAGDDTIMVAVRTTEETKILMQKIEQLIG